ncbi:MAG: hypothetical protein E6R03_15575 [Hyphomicrobiaceae bacterium]|nr:MAG: hypothetical protein E6R03_15575 [Hyphomicrobiaceae bacterium]
MASKFTPGPWEAHGDGIRTVAEPGWLIATMGNTFHDNCPLIAEAPEMLAALRKLVDHIRAIQSDGELEATTDGLGILFGDVMAEDVEGAEAILARIDGPTFADEYEATASSRREFPSTEA